MADRVVDQLKRPLQDLRISVTDRCNFRCAYCMPAEIFGPDFQFLPKDKVLSFEEIEMVASVFADLGVRKLRLTGGEPLLRRDLPVLIGRLTAIDGIEDIGLTTNGVLLTKQAPLLYEAGLRRLNISLDALNDEVFKKLNGKGISSKTVLKGIDTALETGFEIKVNMVVQKGVNEQEILPMAEYFKELGVPLRFIEFMDVGNSNGWNWERVLTKKQMFGMLTEHFDLEPIDAAYYGEVAKRYRYKGSNAEIGFITSVSESFCSSCTRARISADGKFYTCLFASQGFDVKSLLRANLTYDECKQALKQVWENRNDRYSDERAVKGSPRRNKIEMSYIGG
ncbi:GTP 3',8-cyclase MoaA [Heyndrickxia acidicola]|uniref:GTP 3',8-cyclase n=1 Tax=Heyndrickxia acidicola TaxID=209389 RepID=A0ABU6MA96_9BACI|nr:GTP 3',8-cyclase MoaA [Heyndrickxia acidicola]MED1201556.1 GTP 3',8-cyclase MoaA [Heyndrickxia acidicola]